MTGDPILCAALWFAVGCGITTALWVPSRLSKIASCGITLACIIQGVSMVRVLAK